MPELQIRRLDPAAMLPERAYEDDAGLDLCSIEEISIGPGERAVVRTGIAIELPPGHAGLVLPRSGLARGHGITLTNTPGLIDTGYRGEIEVLLLNTDREQSFTVTPGDRIAQLLIVPFVPLPVVEAEALTVSERSEQGFGSSGA